MKILSTKNYDKIMDELLALRQSNENFKIQVENITDENMSLAAENVKLAQTIIDLNKQIEVFKAEKVKRSEQARKAANIRHHKAKKETDEKKSV